MSRCAFSISATTEQMESAINPRKRRKPGIFLKLVASRGASPKLERCAAVFKVIGTGDYRPAGVAPRLYPGDGKLKALDIYAGSIVQETGWHPNKNPTLDPLTPLNDAETI